MGHLAVAAFAAVDAITVTSELPAPALQHGEAHAQQPSQFAGPGTISHALIKDLQPPPIRYAKPLLDIHRTKGHPEWLGWCTSSGAE